MLPIGGKKEGESSGDESKKRSASPATDNNDSDSVDGARRSRRKKTKVSSVCTVQAAGSSLKTGPSRSGKTRPGYFKNLTATDTHEFIQQFLCCVAGLISR